MKGDEESQGIGEVPSERGGAGQRADLADRQLRDATRLTDAILDASHVGVSAYGPGGDCILANEAIACIVGATREQVLTQNFRHLSSWDCHGLRQVAERVLAEGGSAFNSVEVTSSFGRKLWLEYDMRRFHYRGEPHLLLVVTDGTDRQRTEDELRRHSDHLEGLVSERTESLAATSAEQRQLEAQLLQAQKMDAIGQLSGGIAHDFNNMLAGILGASDLLSRELSDNATAMTHVSLIVDAATRAAELAGQLLALSRKSAAQMVPVDIHEPIERAISILERTIDRRITITRRLDAEPSMVTGDSAQLETIILNLGLNARDAMPEGGGLSISTQNVELAEAQCRGTGGALSPGPHLLIAVRDDGLGMPEDVASHVFEPFFTTKALGEGTGLGLATVYGNVQEHGGHVEVSSRPLQGTELTIYLPLGLETGEPKPVAAQRAIEHGSGHILVIDDEQFVRSIAASILERGGYRVTTADNGVDGVELFARHRGDIDLVVLDMVMPEMNGAEAFSEIRAIDPEARVLISSGFALDSAVTELVDAGAIGFLQKPYRAATLAEQVGEALRDGKGLAGVGAKGRGTGGDGGAAT